MSAYEPHSHTETHRTETQEESGKIQMRRHPFVSESHEGSPAFEWIVLGVVACCTLLAVLRHQMAATIIISVAAIVLGLLRIILRQRSPWKVRSVGFDAFISICWGIGLLSTFFSVWLLL